MIKKSCKVEIKNYFMRFSTKAKFQRYDFVKYVLDVSSKLWLGRGSGITSRNNIHK